MTGYRLGLTGSVGMGKSTTAGFFAEAGVPVWDADAAVHRIYSDGSGAAALGELVPEAVVGSGVDRARLRRTVAERPELLREIERRIHPLVAADREAFLMVNAEADVVLLDIPLLFETGAERWLDGVLVVSAAPGVQRERVLARQGMTGAIFEQMLARQMPDPEKRARADFVILTDRGLDAARADVLSLLKAIRGRRRDA